MALEIERKFLVDSTKWTPTGQGTSLIQAYLSIDPNPTVRIRIAGEKAFLTIKGRSETISRPEFEYEIPVDDAAEMLKLAISNPVEKNRQSTDSIKAGIDYLKKYLHTNNVWRSDNPEILNSVNGLIHFVEEEQIDSILILSLIHISEPTRLGMNSYAV